MLPETQYTPACLLQLHIVLSGALHVALDFTFPIFATRFGQGALADRAAMPETAVHENRKAKFIKNHIRRAWQVGRVFAPASNLHACQHRPQASLYTRGFAFDRLHRAAAILRREVIRHRRQTRKRTVIRVARG